MPRKTGMKCLPHSCARQLPDRLARNSSSRAKLARRSRDTTRWPRRSVPDKTPASRPAQNTRSNSRWLRGLERVPRDGLVFFNMTDKDVAHRLDSLVNAIHHECGSVAAAAHL